jgi:hypothetical protein
MIRSMSLDAIYVITQSPESFDQTLRILAAFDGTKGSWKFAPPVVSPFYDMIGYSARRFSIRCYHGAIHGRN